MIHKKNLRPAGRRATLYNGWWLDRYASKETREALPFISNLNWWESGMQRIKMQLKERLVATWVYVHWVRVRPTKILLKVRNSYFFTDISEDLLAPPPDLHPLSNTCEPAGRWISAPHLNRDIKSCKSSGREIETISVADNTLSSGG